MKTKLLTNQTQNLGSRTTETIKELQPSLAARQRRRRRSFLPFGPLKLLCGALLVGHSAGAATRYVDLNNPTPASPYTSWATAATNIQDAVDEAIAGEEIVVTNGVYANGARSVYGMTNRVAVTKPVTVRSVNGPEVTLIHGYQVPGTTNGAAAIRCVYLTNGAVLAGFTLTNGATQTSGFDTGKQLSGGGVWCESTNAVVTNCVLVRNSATLRGGGAYSGTLNNCTLTGNSAGSGGGAWAATLNNCIVYYNSPNNDLNKLNYCCTTPLPLGGSGNITNAPLFVDTNGWSNLRLQSNSPCLNAGKNAYAPSTTDLDGHPRIAGGTVDIGAYEFQSPASILSHAWLQQYGLPTDGSADYADSDFEGMNNWQEWIAGTNPTNAASALRMLSVSNAGSGISASWSSETNRIYSLERATNLMDAPAFGVVRTNLTGVNGSTSFTDTNATGAGPFFYRVRVEP